jgi:hypothetical protein
LILATLVEQFLETHLNYHPVDASFMGFDSYNHLLPPADSEVVARELSLLKRLQRDAETLEVGNTAAERIETKVLQGQLKHAIAELEQRPRYHNPSCYTGEAAFGIISLLLNDSLIDVDVLRQRLETVPRFFQEGQMHLSDKAVPRPWVFRAGQEARAFIRLLNEGVQKHPLWRDVLQASVETATEAVKIFIRQLENHDTADPACGEAYLTLLMRDVHHLPFSPREAEGIALEDYERTLQELVSLAKQQDASKSWQEQLAALERHHPSLEDVIPTYERFHQQAMKMANDADLLSPANNYGLTFKNLPTWAKDVAGDLYFLFYRSPALARPSSGSVYWVFPPGDSLETYLRAQNFSTIKITHAVHHGSIGHHTQNAFARASEVRLGQLAGTDCASGIAFLSGGTMIEGWACYAQDLLLETEGFYEPQEQLVLKHAELRNAAMCLADLRLHLGIWTLAQMQEFYESIGVSKARAASESTRNSIYPATRLMYWLGTKAIKALRSELGWAARPFHDTLLSFGSVPVYLMAEEMRLQTEPK